MKKRQQQQQANNKPLVFLVIRNYQNGDHERTYLLGASTNFEEAKKIFIDTIEEYNQDANCTIDNIGEWKRYYIKGAASILVRILVVPQNEKYLLKLI